MLKTYQIYKGITAFLIIGIITFVLSLENKEESVKSKTIVRNYELTGDFLFYDPYNINILSKIDIKKKEFNILISKIDHLSNIIYNKSFIEEMFIFAVSKKMNKMESIIQNNFVNDPFFNDFIIIDNKKNLLYKYGSTSFIEDYYNFSEILKLKSFGDRFGIIEKYDDENLDINLEIIALYKNDIILKKLKEFDFPAFFLMDNILYKNVSGIPSIVKNSFLTISNKVKSLDGFQLFETYPVIYQKIYLGNLGIIYPARSMGSIILSIFKILIFLVIVFILVLIDRVLTIKFKRLETEAHNKALKKKDDPGDEKHLDWIENYIQGTEEKK